jgi:dihydrofolate reductase
MTRVRCDMSVSVDGFICGPKAQEPPYLDDGFFRVTSWLTELATWRERQGMAGGADHEDDEVIASVFEQAGAYVMGRRMFDSGEQPWGDEPPFRAPVFVITHREREPLQRAGGTVFYFVTDGVSSAIAQARAAAGDRHVAVSGGASAVQQVITAGLLDELHLHVAPVLLGGGTRLFDRLRPGMVELDRFRLATSTGNDGGLTHLSFRFPNTGGTR